MSRRRLVPLLVCLATLAGCAAAQQEEADSPGPVNTTTTVSVDNRGFLDMTIYVLEGSQRVRLGVARGNGVTPLTIPAHLVRGVTELRFLCDPIGGNRAPVSDRIVVEPGDRVTLFIPPS